MSTFIVPHCVRVVPFGLLAAVGFSASAGAQVDEQINQSVWKQKFGVLDAQMNEQSPYAGWLTEDSDGDGIDNRSEFVAGTNPFFKLPTDAHFRPPVVTASPTTLSLTFPTVTGKLYGAESNMSLAETWSKGSLPSVVGDGTNKTLIVPKSAGKFFHITVTDQATQGDQVSDWAKHMLGLSPAAPINAQTSFDANSLATNLEIQNFVSISAVDTVATQPPGASAPAGDYGVLRVARSGFMMLGAVTVPLAKSGTAVEGVDIESLPSSLTFPAGVNSLDVRVTPRFNANRTSPATVFLTVAAPGSGGSAGNYTLGSPASAGVTVYPSGNPTGTGLIGNYFVGANNTYTSNVNFGGNAATYTYTKTNTTTGSAVITYTGVTGYSTTSPNNRVNLKFSTGALLGGTYDGIATITAVSGNTVTVSITGASVPNSQTGSANCVLNPPVITRLDPTVAFSWLQGTPNGAQYTAADNYSVVWEGYLSPTTAGNYAFQLDADAKAEVFLDLDPADGYGQMVRILENGWDSAATGGFKQSAQHALAIPGTPANRYKMLVRYVETTGNAKCRFQWKRDSGSFGNISDTNVFTNNTGTTKGWAASYYSNTTFTPPTVGTRTDTAITNGNNGDWGAGSPDPLIFHDHFCGRWTGQILPQYSETYSIVVNADDSAKLWINGQLQTLRRLTSDNPSVPYTYTRHSSTTGTIVISYNSAPLTVGDIIPLRFTSGTLSPAYSTSFQYEITAVTGTNFTVGLTGTDLPASDSNSGIRCVIDTTNLGVDWQTSVSVDRYCTIPLLAGVRNDIKLETFEGTGSAGTTLSWFSPSQAKQAIPMSRLFPTMTGIAARPGDPLAGPPVITSETEITTLLNSGGPFNFAPTSNNGGIITASGLPPWLTFVNGVLTGTPPGVGIYQFTLTSTNSAGSSSVVLTLEVLSSPGQLTRETWTSGVTGGAISEVPWTTPPTTTDTVGAAEDTRAYGNNTGARLRGYFIAPTTGNYYFWIAGSNSAELWISNDSEPVNKVRRAAVTDSAPYTWNAQPGQKSPWLSLIAGEKYYLEVLHNTGSSGSSSHLSVAWFLDPTGNTANPIANGSGVIPSHVLAPWDNPPTTTIPGTLYVTNLQGVQGLTGITATGGAFLRVNGSSAVLQLNYSGLTSGATSRKIYNSSGAVLFDINAQEKNHPAQKTSDGGYTWNMQASDVTALNNGDVYLGISTLNNPGGEIAGTFGKIAGSQTAPATPAYPTWPPDLHSTSDAANSRFLTQATFGPGPSDMTGPTSVKAIGYRQWIDNQFNTPATKNVPYILANLSSDPQNPYGNALMFNSWWKNSVTAPDQLRQRAAFALSEILVVSDTGPLNNNGRVLADYYDSLLDNCFGNFRDILKQVTLSPAMGVYLDMRGNNAGNLITGQIPNENYAREILQLFSAGLYRTWPDGTLILNSKGNPIPTYGQDEISGFARVFTGWNWGQPLVGGRLPTATSPSPNYLDPMTLIPTRHELGTKRLLDNVLLPAATVTFPNAAQTDPASPYWVYDPQALPATAPYTQVTNLYDINGLRDLEVTFDNIIGNSAVAPYICRQLIQRLVTSHPKPEYVHRVVRAYNGEQNVDGVRTGIRGDMKDVFRAILLDYEARSTTAAADIKFGKQREPLLRVTGPARAFPVTDFPNAAYSQTGTGSILVTTRDANNNPIPHKLISGSVRLSDFVDTGGSSAQVPNTQTYGISNVTSNTFTVNNTGTSSVSYTISGSTAVIAPVGVVEGDQVYVKFNSGGLAGGTYDGVYTVAAGTAFTIPLASAPANTTGGTCLVPKLVSGYTVTGSAGAQTITIQTTGVHNLVVGNSVQLKFIETNSPDPATDGVYQVTSVVGPNSFRVTPPSLITTGSEDGSSVNVFPLKGSHWTRNGKCTVGLSTWGIGFTSSNLNQTPLNSTTVFNFFYPDYQYPGPMAQAGMTTPEFQLTNDSNTMNLTNVITQGAHTNFSGLTNGYGSFFSNNSITMDITPYMTYDLTKDANIPTLVDTLGVLFTGGNLSTSVKNTITNYVLNTSGITYAAPTPTSAQMRDRVRAIVHLITISSEYAIQK